jgi:hypothetical protein
MEGGGVLTLDTIILALLTIAHAEALAADEEIIRSQAARLTTADFLIRSQEAAIQEYEAILTELGL